MKLEYKYKQLLLCAVCATLVYISLTNLESILAYAGTVYTVLKPFIYGAVMAFVINVPMRKVEGMLSKALINNITPAAPVSKGVRTKAS